MPDSKNLFPEFPELTKAQSMEKLRADLKGKAYEDLKWPVNDEIRLDPVFFKEDLPEKLVLPSGKSNDWLIGEQFRAEEAPKTNKTLLHALLNGVDAPGIDVENADKTAITALLNGVETAFVAPFFGGQTAVLADFADHFYQYHLDNGKATDGLKGGFCFFYDKNNTELLQKSILKVKTAFPGYKFLKIADDQPENDPVKYLASLTEKAIDALENLSDEKLDVATLANGLFFSVKIGKQYFVEIAKLRALQLLWGNIQQSFGIKMPEKAFIDVHFAPECQQPDKYDNMIAATTQAMSAAIGGCNRLTVLPSDENSGESSDFSRRIARNVQHMLKMESFLDRVNDPAGGSYFLENLTLELAQKAWE